MISQVKPTRRSVFAGQSPLFRGPKPRERPVSRPPRYVRTNDVAVENDIPPRAVPIVVSGIKAREAVGPLERYWREKGQQARDWWKASKRYASWQAQSVIVAALKTAERAAFPRKLTPAEEKKIADDALAKRREAWTAAGRRQLYKERQAKVKEIRRLGARARLSRAQVTKQLKDRTGYTDAKGIYDEVKTTTNDALIRFRLKKKPREIKTMAEWRKKTPKIYTPENIEET
jgi:hypothetical protein